MIHAVIMAGGSGTRFWPLSTKNKPKQCLSFFSDKTLMEETVDRLLPLFNKTNIHIATNEKLAEQMKKVLPEINYILEPCAKNTTGCIGLACIEIIKKDPEALIFIETADHTYKDVNKYLETVKKAIALAKEGKIITIGIKPTYAFTGFGYIQPGKAYKEGFLVESFREKPNKETAEKFLKEGFLWNSGMYIFKAKKMLEELEKYEPEIYKHLTNISNGANKKEEFSKIKSIAIDYAVSERSKDLVILKADMDWDDIGSWDSLDRMKPQDKEGNIILGKHSNIDSNNNIIYSKKLVSTIGIKDFVIVETDKAILICPKDRACDVGKLVKKLKEEGKEEFL
jgi:mannose-1-phosphate guanylyltransferase